MSLEKEKRKIGFAIMSPEKQRELASRGGKAAHAKGVSHVFTQEEAHIAGQRGGAKLLAERGPAWFKKLGAIGGKARARRWNADLEDIQALQRVVKGESIDRMSRRRLVRMNLITSLGNELRITEKGESLLKQTTQPHHCGTLPVTEDAKETS